jgi:hypothetical protein
MKRLLTIVIFLLSPLILCGCLFALVAGAVLGGAGTYYVVKQEHKDCVHHSEVYCPLSRDSNARTTR